MSAYFDRQEVQTAKSRDAALFRDLKGILSFAMMRAPSLREQLRGVDLSKLRTRADLAHIPVMTRSDLLRLQRERPPLGGLAARSAGSLKALLIRPGPICLPDGNSKDWWRAARAMNAAGFRKGDVVLNGFCYYVGAAARMVESGAQALGCVIAPVVENTVEWRADALMKLGPCAYCGPADRLDQLIRAFEIRGSGDIPINRALFFDESSKLTLGERLRRHRIDAYFCYAPDELGVVAYETKLDDGAFANDLVVNESVIVEIVRPNTGEPLPFGSVGEIVVTRLNSEFPLLRFATGDVSMLLPGPSPCGRTNLRLRKRLGRVDASEEQRLRSEVAVAGPAGQRNHAAYDRAITAPA